MAQPYRKLSDEHKRNIAKNKVTLRGEDNGRSKLTTDDVITIKKRLQVGEFDKSIAKDYDVHFTAISKIRRGVNWKHIKV